MSGRSTRGEGWDKPRTPSWVYALVGILLTLVVVLAIVIFMLLGNGNSGLASATATPTVPPAGATPTAATTESAGPTPTPAATQAAGPTPTTAPTPEVTPASTPIASGSPAPSGSTKPTLVSITIPHSADCNTDYGNGVGQIKISWSISGATGVRISIDPPSPATAYASGFADYASNTTSAWVPFACGSTSHLYVVTTLHTTGYYQYRYAKVIQVPAPTP
jgi:hypothetical protein